jgi:hypothetical protein
MNGDTRLYQDRCGMGGRTDVAGGGSIGGGAAIVNLAITSAVARRGSENAGTRIIVPLSRQRLRKPTATSGTTIGQLH